MTRNLQTRRRTDADTSHRAFRPRLECLEDRAVPATFTVNTALDDVIPANGKQSLREAIARANTTAGADTIVLPAGVFKITLVGAGENGNATGDFDITDTLTIQGAGAGLSIVDGQQLDRVLDVAGTAPSSIKVVLQGLTVRNGDVAGHGGGVLFGNADLVVRDSVVSGNRASQTGGGISNGAAPETGNVTLVRTTVARNAAGTDGGGIAFTAGVTSSVLTVNNGTVRRNVAGNVGGGISADKVTLTNSVVSGNRAGGNVGGINAVTAALTNCTVSGNIAGMGAGGILATTATLANCTVSGNMAGGNAGGIGGVTVTLTNSTVSGNTAGGEGGGIRAVTAALTNCTVSGNTARGNFGGGIRADTATLTNCNVSGNSAGFSGGGINAIINATLTNCNVSGNSAGFSGGGIAAGTSTLTKCTVSGNVAAAGSGGGIAAITAATLTNTTVSGNSAATEGGGIWAGAATLLNCTIVENIAQTGGGVFHNPGGTFSVKNTLIALNLVGFSGTGPDVSGAFASGGHNLIGNGAGGTGFTDGLIGDIVGTSVNPIDPKLGVLKNNGGKTKTHALKAASPAIDRGDNANLPPTDQRGTGFARKKDGDGNGTNIADIGAFEK